MLWILAMLGAALIVREELDEGYDSLMEETANRLLPFMAGSETPALPPRAEALLTWALHDAGGLRHSDDADPADFPANPPEGFSSIGDQRHFVRSSGGMTLDIASPLQERREALHGVMTALILPALALLPLCLWGIIWFTNRRLRPVAALSAEVAGRSPGRSARPDHPCAAGQTCPREGRDELPDSRSGRNAGGRKGLLGQRRA